LGLRTILNENEQKKLAGEIAVFAKQYGRRAHKRHDPNDSGYDRKIEEKMKRLKPEDLSDLLSDDLESAKEE
jgi:hypothetical protein